MKTLRTFFFVLERSKRREDRDPPFLPRSEERSDHSGISSTSDSGASNTPHQQCPQRPATPSETGTPSKKETPSNKHRDSRKKTGTSSTRKRDSLKKTPGRSKKTGTPSKKKGLPQKNTGTLENGGQETFKTRDTVKPEGPPMKGEELTEAKTRRTRSSEENSEALTKKREQHSSLRFFADLWGKRQTACSDLSSSYLEELLSLLLSLLCRTSEFRVISSS